MSECLEKPWEQERADLRNAMHVAAARRYAANRVIDQLRVASQEISEMVDNLVATFGVSVTGIPMPEAQQEDLSFCEWFLFDPDYWSDRVGNLVRSLNRSRDLPEGALDETQAELIVVLTSTQGRHLS